MQLPKTGRVAIIDDKPDEALPLIKALSQSGIPSLYFCGELDSLPASPLNSIRVVFLDIELATESQTEKNKLSKLKSVLGAIIDKENGPYIIIAWTKYKTLVPKILKVLRGNKPILILTLDKGSCKDISTGDFSPTTINSEIKKELKKIGMFGVFNTWEELISQSSHKVINDISNLYRVNKDWQKNVSRVFYKLAQAYSGRTLTTTSIPNILTSSLLAFNSVFSDTVENTITAKEWEDDFTIIETQGAIDSTTLSKINSKLHTVFGPSKVSRPGNIYSHKLTRKQKMEMLNDYIDPTYTEEKVMFSKSLNKQMDEVFDAEGNVLSSFKARFKTFRKLLKERLFKQLSVIKIEISPECDYIQKKRTTHRFVLGIIWPYKYTHLMRKKTGYLYSTPILYIRNKPQQIIFDLRSIISKPVEKLINANIICRLRKELIIELQSFLSNHISRPGVLFLDHLN